MKHSRVISIDAEKQFDKIKHLFLGWEIPWRRTRLPTPVFLGFPGVSAGKGSAWQAGHLGSIPGLGRSPGEGNSALLMRWPKYWSFSFISPSSEHPGLISFRMDSLDLLAVQGTLKSLLQHHSSKDIFDI